MFTCERKVPKKIVYLYLLSEQVNCYKKDKRTQNITKKCFKKKKQKIRKSFNNTNSAA